MSATMVRWTDKEEVALTACQSRLQKLHPGGTLQRADVLKILVQAFASRTTPEELLKAQSEKGA